MKERLKEKTEKHLRGDIREYDKEIRHLKKEKEEDLELIRDIKRTRSKRGKR